jgi:hypothetical protein
MQENGMPIFLETRLFVNYGNNHATAIMHVVADCEIGFPVILGMDTPLALGMKITMNKASCMNPLYPISGENWTILSTGLTMSLASPEWFQESNDAVAINYKGPPTIYDQITKTTVNILGKS